MLRRQNQPNKSYPSVHGAVLFKRHRQVLPADRKLSPIIPVQFVTSLSGLHNGTLSRLRERVGVRGGQERRVLKTDPHPALRATFSRKREKGFRVPKIDDSDA